MNFLQIRPLGERAISIAFQEEISVKRLREVLFLKNQLEALQLPGLTEIITAYASIVITFDPFLTEYDAIVSEVRKMQIPENPEDVIGETRCAIIPVCYDEKLAPDLRDYLGKKKLTRDAFVSMHAGVRYTFYMFGFVPGFMYFGGLDPSLHIARKETPALRVPAGSVAIGGAQTGIYALSSPGGWYVVGRTPVGLVDISIRGDVIHPGDEVIFRSIGIDDFIGIQNDIKREAYKIDFLP